MLFASSCFDAIVFNYAAPTSVCYVPKNIYRSIQCNTRIKPGLCKGRNGLLDVLSSNAPLTDYLQACGKRNWPESEATVYMEIMLRCGTFSFKFSPVLPTVRDPLNSSRMLFYFYAIFM